jgi:prepilin peptidase CpaA
MFSDPHTESVISGLAFDALLRNSIVFAFAGLLITAAITDLRQFIIPDAITVGLLGLWPIWAVLNGVGPIGFILLGAVVVFALGVALFSFGFMGGGDVKLLTVLALWAEPSGLPTLLLFTSIAGGLLSLFWVLPLRQLIAPVIGWTAGQSSSKKIPYGVAIAAGGLVVAQRLVVG